MVWTKLPTGGGPRSITLVLPAKIRRLWTRCAFLWFRRPLGSKPPRHGSAGRALAPGVCPVPWYSDERGGAFSGLVRSRFLKVPRTTSAGKPDANFLLEILAFGLQQKFQEPEWRMEGTIRPPINAQAPGHSAPWAKSLSVGSGPYRGDPRMVLMETSNHNVARTSGEVSTLKDQGILAAALHELLDFSPAFIDATEKAPAARYSLMSGLLRPKLAHSARSKSRPWTHLRAWTGIVLCIDGGFSGTRIRAGAASRLGCVRLSATEKKYP